MNEIVANPCLIVSNKVELDLCIRTHGLGILLEQFCLSYIDKDKSSLSLLDQKLEQTTNKREHTQA